MSSNSEISKYFDIDLLVSGLKESISSVRKASSSFFHITLTWLKNVIKISRWKVFAKTERLLALAIFAKELHRKTFITFFKALQSGEKKVVPRLICCIET